MLRPYVSTVVQSGQLPSLPSLPSLPIPLKRTEASFSAWVPKYGSKVTSSLPDAIVDDGTSYWHLSDTVLSLTYLDRKG